MNFTGKRLAEVLRREESRAALLFVIFFAVGTLGHLLASLRPTMRILTPGVLWFSGLLALAFWWAVQPERWPSLLGWAVLTYVLTFFLEALGTHTGWIFGAYTYGEGLGPRLFSVPLVIGFNWTVVVLGCGSLFATVSQRWLRPPLTALACVAFDVILEPLAMDPRMDYWFWEGGMVPLQNYLAWFWISLAAAWALEALRLRPAGIFGRVFVLTQAGFFLILHLAFQSLGLP